VEVKGAVKSVLNINQAAFGAGFFSRIVGTDLLNDCLVSLDARITGFSASLLTQKIAEIERLGREAADATDHIADTRIHLEFALDLCDILDHSLKNAEGIGPWYRLGVMLGRTSNRRVSIDDSLDDLRQVVNLIENQQRAHTNSIIDALKGELESSSQVTTIAQLSASVVENVCANIRVTYEIAGEGDPLCRLAELILSEDVALETPTPDLPSDGRNKWLYSEIRDRQCTVRKIRERMNSMASSREGWAKLGSDSAVMSALKRFAKRKGLPYPPC